MGRADPLAGQQFSRREFVERSANVSGIVELPPTYERIRERLHGVTVVTLQLIDQTGRDCSNRAIRYRFAALKRYWQGADGLPVSSGLERQNVAMSGRTDG